MADVDIDPFGEHESRTEEPTDENIPLDPVTPAGGGRSTWEPEREQETSQDYLLWFLLHLLWFFHYLIFFCHFIIF